MFLVKLILFFILFYWLVKLSTRFFAPYLLKKMVSKMQEKAAESQGNYYDRMKKEGEVNVIVNDQEKKVPNDNSGEYIDYEEINDHKK